MSESAKYYDLTHSQKGIWYTEKLYPGTSIGNIAGTLKINGQIDFRLLEQAILTFIEKNEALHLRFTEKDGEPYQYVSKELPTSLDYIDFSTTGLQSMFEWDARLTQMPFQIFGGCLFYFALLKISDQDSGFYFKIHHLICDGWSIIHATNEIMHYYSRLRNAETNEDIQPSYLEFVKAENDYLGSPKFARDREFWRSHFATVPELSTLKTRNSKQIGSKAKRKTVIIPSRLTKKIQEYCKEYRTSAFTLFLSALAIYMNRVTGQEDLVIGVPVLNRANIKEKDTMGMFVGTVPMRIRVEDQLCFKEFCDRISKSWVGILKHHKYPFDLLLKEVREKSRNTDELYDIILSYQNAKFVRSEFSHNHEGRWHFNGHQKQALYIHINDREDEGNLILDFDYLVDMYYPREIDFIQDHLSRILWHALDNPQKVISRIDMISEKERRRILYDFNDTFHKPDSEKTIPRCIEEQAERNGLNPALLFENSIMTYGDFNRKANQMARTLKKVGVGSGSIVGIMTKRSPEMLVGIVSVLKAGGAYLPIDPDYPEDRIRYMLEDSGTKILLNYGVRKDDLVFSGTVIDLADSGAYDEDSSNLPRESEPDALGYVIYTSGSTGEPKGVMLRNRGLDNLVSGVAEIVDFSSVNTVLSITTMSFDIFIFETLLPLANGLKVVIANEDEQKLPMLIGDLIKRHQIDLVQTTPSRMQMILSDPDVCGVLGGLKKIILGGEALPSALVEKLQKHTEAKIYNGYGPTETTVYSTFKRIYSSKDVNIGKPVANTRIYILDKYLNPLPIGAAGEIYIGGDGLGQGYINKPQMTNERFIQDPFHPSRKIYRTGDLARWYPAGEIEYLGRIDHQVKIRGLRIELGEIENLLLKYTGINKVAVVDRQDDKEHKFLCAYFEGDETLGAHELRPFLSKRLPNYMIPSYFMQLEQLPLTPSGKVDRNRLPMVDTGLGNVQEYFAPENSTEVQLAVMWQNILGIEKISTNENFFEIGGDSLFAIHLISRIHKEMNVEISLNSLFQYSTISELAKFILEKEQHRYEEITKAEKTDYYPVTSQQKRLYMLKMIEGDNQAYNMPGVFDIEGSLDVLQLERAFQLIVERHDVFRTSFGIVDGELVQTVSDQIQLGMDYQTVETLDLDSEMAAFIRDFDLSRAPLLRVKLLTLSSTRHFLLCDMHHIIADGTSLNVLFSDLFDLYNGRMKKPLKIQYSDYADWQKRIMATEMMRQQEKFWLKYLAGEIAPLNLPANYPRKSVQSYAGKRSSFKIPMQLSGDMKKLANASGSTLYMVLLSMFYVLLYNYTGQEDIIVGTPISNRNQLELQNIVGMFSNTIVLRSFPNSAKTFGSFLKEVRESCISAYENQMYPFDDLVTKLKLKRDLSRNPLFDVMFILQNSEIDNYAQDEFRMKRVPWNSGFSKFDLTFEAFDKEDGIEFSIEYAADLFDTSTIERMALHYLKIAESFTYAPQLKLLQVDIASREDRELIYGKFNNTGMEYPVYKTINELFEEQAAKTPDRIAVVSGDTKTTYKNLNADANRKARILVNRGVGNNVIVGIMMNRSIETLSTILAILKAGGAYLPLDPGYPQERIKYMVEDSRISLIVTDAELKASIQYDSIRELCLVLNSCNPAQMDDTNLIPSNTPESALYTIYTSGSTGKPKAVVLEHRNMLNLLLYSYTDTNINFTHRVLQYTTISFDVSAQEMFSTLLAGGELYILPDSAKHNMEEFVEFISINRPNVLFMPPTFLKLLLSCDEYIGRIPTSVQHLIVAGEQLIISDPVKKFLKDRRVFLHNHYGPSETHVVTAHTISPEEDIPSLPPIGKPITNTGIHILNSCGMLQPVGIAGELYISGDSVGRGYLNREELTSEKFVKSYAGPGERMYKTGDLARWMPDGTIEFLGRNDDQVKIRGFRIELGEIENQLLNHPLVTEASVVVKTDAKAGKSLCAYYVAENAIPPTIIRAYLKKQLPEYMIPAYFVKMESLPMTPSGKVDRRNLPAPVMLEAIEAEQDNGPRNETDHQLMEIWREVLGITMPGIDTNFFEAGGDSLSLIMVQIKAMKYNWGLKTQDFYNHQTIRELSDYVHLEHVGGFTVDLDSGDELIEPKERSFYFEPEMENVLITGATGFLGIHILKELLECTPVNVYCIIREKHKQDSLLRIVNLLDFYFGKEFSQCYADRIHVINGDITKKDLGLGNLNKVDFENKIDAVIHAAALVKHYGNYNQFEKVNVSGTKHIIEYCMQYNVPLYHVSTIGILGNQLQQENRNEITRYTEDDFVFSHTDLYDNVYLKSKYKAETLFLKGVQNGLKGGIFRVGNLTGRVDDGKFQININENAFYNRIKSIIELGMVPEDMLDTEIEFTPVDCCSKAIVKSVFNHGMKPLVYHMFNPNAVTMAWFIQVLNRIGLPIHVTGRAEFSRCVENISKDETHQKILSGVVQDFNGKEALTYGKNLSVSCVKTQDYLGDVGFEWPVIDQLYIEKLIAYMKNNHFLKEQKFDHVI